MGQKIRCLKCNDLIEGDGFGTFISCKCGSCYVDETKYYCRVGGDPSQMNTFDKDGNEVPMVSDIKDE